VGVRSRVTIHFRILACVVGLLSAARVVGDNGAIDGESFIRHVRYLASDELEGRGNGTEGLERAADYISRRFREAGLEPGGVNGTFFQPFEIVAGVQALPGQSLKIRMEGRDTEYEIGADYYPLSFAHDGRTGPEESLAVVFAGYGISAPDLGYDDYDGLDVAGRAVLAFSHEPQEQDPASPFDGRSFSRHATLMQKAMAARSRGAKLLLILGDPSHEDDRTGLRRWNHDPQAEQLGISVLRLSKEAIRSPMGGLDLTSVARSIDADLKPRSQELSGVRVHYTERLRRVQRTVRNVVGRLPGTDPVRHDEAVVLGAHYDHLGRGGRFSLQENAAGEIHNGADDNASGTAALIEVARAAATDRRRFGRSLVFIAFAAEEIGLLGSSHYVQRPSIPLDKTMAMINLDMVGRPDGRLLVSGLDSAPDLEPDLRAALETVPLTIRTFREGANVGSSDDTSFVTRRVPAIGFFSGFHSDYHRPSDDWNRIDAEGGAAVARLALELAERYSNRADRIAFTGAPRHERLAHGAAEAPAPSGGGYGPYFGSVPDFVDDGKGVRFAEIREHSPADKAGLRRGDVLVRFDGTPIATLYDFTFALRERRPGDSVPVVVIRAGKEVTATVRLASRP
jgi:hypothetical protein